MSDIKEWASDASGNQQAPPDGAQENNFTGPDVNDWGRETMAAVKRMYNAHEYVDSITDDANQPATPYPVAKNSDTQFAVVGVDVASGFLAGQRVLMRDSAQVGTVAYVTSATFTGGNTVVDVEDIEGAGIVPTDLAEVFHPWLRELQRPAYLDNGNQDDEVVTGADLGDEGTPHPRLGVAAYKAVGTAAGELAVTERIIDPTPTGIGLGTAALVDTGTGAAEVPTNAELGSFAQTDKPQLKYQFKLSGQTHSNQNENDIIDLTGIDIPGADGTKRYRLFAYICWRTARGRPGNAEIKAYVGVNGSSSDGTPIFYGRYSSPSRDQVAYASGVIQGVEAQQPNATPPAAGMKLGLSFRLIENADTGSDKEYVLQGNAALTGTRCYFYIEEIIAEGF